MYNVLRILLHRPFVSDGDLHSSPSNAINSFLVCATAAKEIVKILRAYDAAFSIQRAPYLISYATYVSATIHVRIAAQREPGSEAHICLATCLDVFLKNQGTNWAVRRANGIIRNLMKRMNVSISASDGNASVMDVEGPSQLQLGNDDSINHHASERQQGLVNPSVANEWTKRNESSSNQFANINDSNELLPTASDLEATSNLDIDAIINSFIQDQQAFIPTIEGAGVNGMLYDQPTMNQWNSKDISAHDPLTPLAISGDDQYDIGYVQQSQKDMFSVNDMLFGFNSSAMEGIGWDFDDPMV